MTLWTRRIVYIFFLIIFAVAAPLLILYTQGYRYDTTRRRLEPTGTMVLSTIPKGATITLNGQVANFLTPKTLQAIIPGTYTVQLSKEGYKSWAKQLTVKAGEAVFVSNIHLWRNSLPMKISDLDFKIFSPSPDKSSVLLTSLNGNQERFYLFDTLPDSQPYLIFERPMRQPSEQIIWSPQMNKALVIGPNDTGILNINSTPTWQSLGAIAPKNIKKIRWDPNYDNLLYGSDGQIVYRIDIDQKKIFPLIPDAPKLKAGTVLTDYWVGGNALYEILRLAGRNSVMRRTNIPATSAPYELELPTNRVYQALLIQDNIIVLADSAKTMSVWRSEGDSYLPVLDDQNVGQAVFLASATDAGDLLYARPFELWTFNPKTGVKNLLTRIAYDIVEASWYPDGSHVIFESGNALNMIERDERDIRNQWTLTPYQNITGYTINPSGKNIFFAGTLSSDTGLWRLDL